jgi:hypothetical protein
MNNTLLLVYCSFLFFSAFSLFVSSSFSINIGIGAVQAQPISLDNSSKAMLKALLSDANETLRSENTAKTVQNLLEVQRMMTQINDTSSSIEDSKLLVRESVGALLHGRNDIAATNLNLIYNQLFTEPENVSTDTVTAPIEKPVTSNQPSLSENLTSDTVTSLLEKPVIPIQPSLPQNVTTNIQVNNGTSTGFLTYDNNLFGIKIQYPNTWSAKSYQYSIAGNNTVVGFYSPSKTASQLGNVSGVSGQFVPYLDIFVFDSKNMSLDEIIDGRMNRIKNYTYFAIHESEPFTLKGNQEAYSLVYSTTTGGDELFKKMQIYTKFGHKVYLITFTAQEALFANYLPTVQNMIKSFELHNIS